MEAEKLIPIARQLLNGLYEESKDRPGDEDVRSIAEVFCNLDDDKQAKFFVHVAQIMGEWDGGSYSRDIQAIYIGNHLRTCACSTEESREFLKSISEAMNGDKHNESAP